MTSKGVLTMTLKEHQQITRAKYATACMQAKERGKSKPDWELFKQQHNYYGTTNIVMFPQEPTTSSTTKAIKDNARRQEKAIKSMHITIKNIMQQMDILDDFFHDLATQHPEYKTYHKLSDYILGAICDISEKLEIL